MTDESNIGWWLWLALFIDINATWIGMDLFLRARRHEYLTIEVREILAGGGWRGLGFAAMIGATFAIIAYHFFWQR